jgi:hypothetical protein
LGENERGAGFDWSRRLVEDPADYGLARDFGNLGPVTGATIVDDRQDFAPLKATAFSKVTEQGAGDADSRRENRL